MLWKSRCVCCFIPPHILDNLAENDDKAVRDRARAALVASAVLRAERKVRASFAFAGSSPAGGRRTVFNCRHSSNLNQAVVARGNGDGPTRDPAINDAWDGFKATYEFYDQVLGRNSIDDQGMRLDGYVHYSSQFNNAFWDGQRMVFGDGDGDIFTDFTGSLDVIGHELTHGVTEFTAGLVYENQSGALNESISDVFGTLVKQWKLGQDVNAADWLIGPEIFTPNVQGDALRSMKNPGQAYDDPRLGKDPQPAHMRDFKELPNTQAGDNGGVHINSGIPNKAFFLFASKLGGHAWERAGKVWYASLRASSPDTDFQAFANLTGLQAAALCDAGVRDAVAEAWDGVGIQI